MVKCDKTMAKRGLLSFRQTKQSRGAFLSGCMINQFHTKSRLVHAKCLQNVSEVAIEEVPGNKKRSHFVE